MRDFVRLLWCPLLLAAAVWTPTFAAGTSDCAICHEEVVADFGKTAHARAAGWDPESGCESCHGPGEAHIDAGGDPESIVRPQTLPRAESSAGCLSCHDRHERLFRSRQAVHRPDDVGCLDCHNPHVADEHLLVERPLELCSSCHPAAGAQFEMPRAHPIDERGEACVSCHDPHAARKLRWSPVDSVRTCDDCHFEKTGPFLYDHGSLLVDGCASCHEVHGSTNRHLLRHDSQVVLCYECHSANVTPGWHSAPRYTNRKCTACHEAIHGSNTSQFFLEE